MQVDAYRRARQLKSSRRSYAIARALGFIQSLLIVVLLGVIALFVALLASRGEARFPASKRCCCHTGWLTALPVKISSISCSMTRGFFRSSRATCGVETRFITVVQHF